MALQYAMQQVDLPPPGLASAAGPASDHRGAARFAIHRAPVGVAAQKSWREVRVLVIDTETTGINVTEDRVVELGAAYLTAGQQSDLRRMRLNPERPIPAEASQIHGIYDHHVKHKPTFRQVAARFLSHLTGAALGGGAPCLSGYNATGFDVPVLNAELVRAGRPERIGGDDVLDLMLFVKWHHRSLRKRSLACVCEHYGIPLLNAHSAAADASATGALMFRMIDAGLIPESVHESLVLQRRMKQQLDDEWDSYRYWLYADRDDGRLRLGAGRHCGAYLDAIEPDYLEYLLRDIQDLPPEVRRIFRARLPS